jgi:MOSC domain-containing protein YiiM
MKLISVNVGLPREITVAGKTVRTSIWKYPVRGRIHVSTLNLDGDQQSDLSVHGGVDKAVYLYPSEHYSYWRTQLPGVELPWGAFGENFTSEGILEDQIRIGDRIRVGSADFMVTQPRMPCFKLGIRFNRRDMVKRFLESKRTGFYLAVIREGEVEDGDPIEFIEKQETGVTITDIVNLYTVDSRNQELLRRATELSALPQSWKDYFRKRLWNADA